VVEGREKLSIVRVEECGLRGKELFGKLATSPVTIRKAIGRGIRRRVPDHQYREALEELDLPMARRWDQGDTARITDT